MPRKKIELPAADAAKINENTPGIPAVCANIRYFREKSGMEQKELARRIGVTANAVSNWETGRSRPDINLIPGICSVLGVSFGDIFGRKNPQDNFSDSEKLIIKKCRRLSAGHLRAAEELIDSLLRSQESDLRMKTRKLLFFERPLAAGVGDPTELEENGEPMLLLDSPELKNADYVFPVNGESMEPKFRSGDMVLVRKASDIPPLAEGEIGAFIVGNETYIKEYRRDGLYSLNKKYRPMRFDGDERVFLIGKVTGILDRELIIDRDGTANDKY